MGRIEKRSFVTVAGDLTNYGWSADEVAKGQNSIYRDRAFKDGVIYGSEADPNKGMWKAELAGYTTLLMPNGSVESAESDALAKRAETLKAAGKENEVEFKVGDYITITNKAGKLVSAKVLNKGTNWRVAYYKKVDDKEILVDYLSRTFLLKADLVDKYNKAVPAVGSVREWAKKNIVDFVYDSKWTADLASELNARGLKVRRTTYATEFRSDAKLVQPYFADDYEDAPVEE